MIGRRAVQVCQRTERRGVRECGQYCDAVQFLGFVQIASLASNTHVPASSVNEPHSPLNQDNPCSIQTHQAWPYREQKIGMSEPRCATNWTMKAGYHTVPATLVQFKQAERWRNLRSPEECR
jgi:hypothetical protein